jgi:hypothetical protein
MATEFEELKVKDRTAAAELVGVLQSPILLAECPNKYNGAGFDDYWYAAQLGMSRWERSHDFGTGSGPWVTERVTFGHPKSDGPVPDCLLASDRLAAARNVLKGLQLKQWRELIGRALDGNKGNDSLIGLIHCFGQPWLYRSRPNCGGGDTWTWDEHGQLYHTANALDRLDTKVGRWYPLGIFEQLDARRFSILTREAQRYFAPPIKDFASHEMLAKSLADVVAKVREITPELVVFSLNAKFFAYSRFVWKGVEYQPRNRQRPTAVGEKLPVEVVLLDKLLGNILTSKWGEHFGAAYGSPLRLQGLDLFVTGDDAVLVRDNSAFRIAHSGLTFAGLCDYPGGGFPNVQVDPV